MIKDIFAELLLVNVTLLMSVILYLRCNVLIQETLLIYLIVKENACIKLTHFHNDSLFYTNSNSTSNGIIIPLDAWQNFF